MRKRQNEEIIYEVALGQFAKKGYKKTTLDDIASRLNMTNANLYCYASSKQALYQNSVAYAMTKWQNYALSAIESIADPVEKLIVLFDSAVQYFSEDMVFCQIFKADPEVFSLFSTVDPYEEINKKSLLILKNILSDGIEMGVFVNMDADESAQILFSMYKAIIIESYVKSNKSNYLKCDKEARNLLLYGIIKNK